MACRPIGWPWAAVCACGGCAGGAPLCRPWKRWLCSWLRSWQRIAVRDAEYTRDTAVLLKVPRCVLLRHHAVLDVWLRRHRAPLPPRCLCTVGFSFALGLHTARPIGPSNRPWAGGRKPLAATRTARADGTAGPLECATAVGQRLPAGRCRAEAKRRTASAADRGQHVREGRHVRVLAGRVGRHSGGARVVCCPHAGKRTRLRSRAPVRSHLPLWHASCVQCSGRMLRLGRSAWLLMRAVAVRFQLVLRCTHVHERALVRALLCACVFAHGTALLTSRS